MKAEERKRLETNVLADRMGRLVKDIRKGPSRRSLLVWVIVIAVIVSGIIFYILRMNRSQLTSGQNVRMLHGTKADLDYLEKAHPKTVPGQVARFQLAWVRLWDQGIQGMIQQTDPTIQINIQAFSNVMNAKSEYQKLYAETKDDPILGAEALYGLALAQETEAIYLMEKSLERAKLTFQTLANDERYKGSAFAKRAVERLKHYEGEKYDELKNFYRPLYNSLQMMLQKLPKQPAGK